MNAVTVPAEPRVLGPLGAWMLRIPVRVRVLVFACMLACLGGGVLLVTPDAPIMPERAWTMPFLAIVIGFGIAEATALHVEIRKESHSLSLSGIPLMFGLLYLSPLLVALAYVIGSAPTMLWIRKSDPVKTTWNCCLFFAEAAVGALIVRSFLGHDLPAGALEWTIPLGAVLVAELMSLLAVPLVIMTVDATFRPHLFADVGQSQVLAALAGTFTVTAVAVSTGSPYMGLYAIAPVVGVGALLRINGHQSQRYRDLQKLHTFTHALANERGHRTLDIGLVELVQIMRARTAGLLVMTHDDDDHSTLRLLADDSFEDRAVDPVTRSLVDLVEGGSVTQLTRDDPRRVVQDLLDHLGAQKVLAARVLTEAERVGVLFVTDRLGMRSEFSADELRLFGSLANTLSARLSNDHLVERLEVQARRDSLTGLPNRLTFEIALAACLARPTQSGVVVMVDLDRFKEINDSLGHETGDRLLIEMANRLRSAARPSDVVARFGGDEFALLLTYGEADGPGDFTRRISDIHDQLTAKVELEGIRFEVGASLGVVQWPAQGRDTASLLHRADTAMYEAKRNQLGVVWYTPVLDADAPRRLDLYLSASAALEDEQFYIHLQPKVSLRDGRITGAEALVRWTHAAHGPISPAEFIPLIVQAGLSGRLTRFVIERAAAAITVLRDAGLDLPVAVNLTPRDLLDPALPSDIARILSAAGVPTRLLQLEIIEESMVVDFETSVSVLNQLRHLGVQIALDDFGTGYSSLQHLHRLPVDHLKIDRGFIERLSGDGSAAAIVRASINLANELGLTTIAEGIESNESLRLISGLGCNEIQGFLVSRPLPSTEFVRFALGWSPDSLIARLHPSAPGLRHTSTEQSSVSV